MHTSRIITGSINNKILQKRNSNKYKKHFENEESSRDGGAKSTETRIVVVLE